MWGVEGVKKKEGKTEVLSLLCHHNVLSLELGLTGVRINFSAILDKTRCIKI